MKSIIHSRALLNVFVLTFVDTQFYVGFGEHLAAKLIGIRVCVHDFLNAGVDEHLRAHHARLSGDVDGRSVDVDAVFGSLDDMKKTTLFCQEQESFK